MINFFKLVYYSLSANIEKKTDPDLIRYFKSEFGSDWKPELEKYQIKRDL
tara:strand:+ start:194 stop:343 length:150 start_codon:yes stop_codon:yes gene_type:complete